MSLLSGIASPRTSRRRPLLVLVMVALALPLAAAQAQEDPYAWLPHGGAQTLLDVLESCDECDDLPTILSADRTADEWRAYFEERGMTADADPLDERSLELLVSYLTHAAPTEADGIPANAAQATANDLPADGRLLTLQFCMTCHGIQVSVTLDWRLERWRSLLGGSTHGTLGLSDEEMNLVVNYLANTEVARDDIPEDQIGPPPTQ